MKADARSVKMDRVDDNYIVRINIRALIYLLTLVASATYYWYNTQSKIEQLHLDVSQLHERVLKLEAKHEEEIKKVMGWYEELSLNPLTGFKKKRK
jgi:low affinity Fe/Cu permease|tara:strand:+ start:162 stop:449 length:288 start_codon:yes stop_codon:yes gene_type:complete